MSTGSWGTAILGSGISLTPATKVCSYCKKDISEWKFFSIYDEDNELVYNGCTPCLVEIIRKGSGNNPEVCTCENLWAGCKCGAFEREQNAKTQRAN